MPKPPPSTFARIGRWARSRRVVVEDDSMRPALEPGDRLYFDPGSRARSELARGDIVVVADPEVPGRWLIKRVAALPGEAVEGSPGHVPPGHLFLVGDNAAESRDSRAWGALPLSSIRGVAWYRYGPPARRGFLDGRRDGRPQPRGP